MHLQAPIERGLAGYKRLAVRLTRAEVQKELFEPGDSTTRDGV